MSRSLINVISHFKHEIKLFGSHIWRWRKIKSCKLCFRSILFV